MAVLVTGGAGYIGSHMVLALHDAGEEAVVLDDLSTGFPWAVPDDVPLVEGDIADAALVAKIIAEYDVTAVAHFAARIVVPESVADPLGYYLANTVKSRALIEAVVTAGIRDFVFSSTAAVYGNTTVSPVPEDAPLAPVSPYGRSKLMTEWMLADAAQAHGLRYVVLRYFNVAGADPAGRSGQSTPHATHLIKVACQAALGLRPGLDVFGTDYPTPDGSCVRDYIQVTDLAEAHLAALAHLRGGGASGIYNCGYGRGYSVLEVAEAVKRISGVDFPVRLAPRRAGDPASIVADVRRIRADLGWVPTRADLDGIVMQALAWERELLAREGA
ncbi:UDP-glucose 4-epimerase GalE [Chelatococcus sp. SYSU_G07232]|uniref:UDP-glucose 4-epimerase n=1 Tax=Chelatococcus albus TaxID=3047466 RepID=A0ABT7AG17_9HYPH|nr:UDP-glucose 4-epimerase GalE [Chelatococcus sp. SYSU_G07232]MDJ1158316.1 UDP-glucose 4-epimerase GalE [Chelatococcus sp. SYSU_G07232]